MKQLFILMKWDVLLLARNHLFVIAVAIAAIYTGVFYLIRPVDNATSLAIVLIFNDPVVTGFMFAGILWLFDKNQNTLSAIAVAPFPLKHYLLSKAVVLSLLAVFVSLCMAFAAVGADFNIFYLTAGVFLASLLLSFSGFVFGALSNTFNKFLALIIPFMIVLAIPFSALFGGPELYWFALSPSAGALGMLLAAFEETGVAQIFFSFVHQGIWLAVAWKVMIETAKTKIV